MLSLISIKSGDSFSCFSEFLSEFVFGFSEGIHFILEFVAKFLILKLKLSLGLGQLTQTSRLQFIELPLLLKFQLFDKLLFLVQQLFQFHILHLNFMLPLRKHILQFGNRTSVGFELIRGSQQLAR